MNRNASQLTFFIVVSVPVVLVEGEVAIRPSVDTKLNGIFGWLFCILNLGSERNNRASADKQGHFGERRGSIDCAAAFYRFAGPEVVPLAFGQIEMSRRCARLGHRIYQ